MWLVENLVKMRWILWALFVHLTSGSDTVRCVFNSMCTCSNALMSEAHQVPLDISCVAVPFYKFPNVMDTQISHMEIQGTNIVSLEQDSILNMQIQSLTIANNKLRSIVNKAFSSTTKILSSLDLSYNELDSIPFNALKELRNLQWLNLHSNQIHTLSGDWSHLKNTVANLFIGGNDIVEIPSDYQTSSHMHGLHQFKTLIWLNLDSNRISHIHKHSLPSGLQTLSISHNLLETFPTELVSGLGHLQWLYLRGNKISVLPEHTFQRKLWLEKIDLSENSIRVIPRRLFNSSVYVRDLNLAFNNIQTLPGESLLGLKCGRIILSFNQLETIDRKAFAGLHESLEYVDLDHNNMVNIPYALNHLKNLKYLYLSSNLIVDIPSHAFQTFCSNLRALSLSGNKITSIPQEALVNCTNISHFNIGYNEIYELLDTDFEFGGNIKTLLLRNNRLTHLKESTFSPLRSLKELSLSFNPLRYVDNNVFNSIPQLESLEISFGLEVDEFPFEILKSLVNLQWLAIDNNNFRTISEVSLVPLGQLRYLNLEGNRLEVIPTSLFRSGVHINLGDVRLSNNNLEVIYSGTFEGLGNLQTLVLFGNRLKTLQKGGFRNLPNLTSLILADNFIKHVEEGAFSGLPQLTRLDLQGNRLGEFSFKYFENVSNFMPLVLNLSSNYISRCESDNKILNIEILDLMYNHLQNIPRCLENVSGLRKLYLDNNVVSVLGHNNFMHLTSLELLSLKRNNIGNLHRHAFFGLQNVQILDLSSNSIPVIHTGQFSNMGRLRILNLSQNRIKYLPKDIFSGTSIEMLDLTHNLFNVIPSGTLIEIKTTLRHLSMGSNFIEHIDSTTFLEINHLQHLDISNNKLTILPDNVFTSLGDLQELDISSNTLRANFKELFHYAQSLKYLNLANIGIYSTPHLPLPNLIHLNLSHNVIQTITRSSFQDLAKLKALFLNNNRLQSIPVHIWLHLPLLKELDLSNNPIKEISSESFYGLHNLQILNLNKLNHVKKFESSGLMQLKILSSLTIQTWSNLENFRPQFCLLLANLTQLTSLSINIDETSLDDQLTCIGGTKIRSLKITGKYLKRIDRDAFIKFARNPELQIQIKNTQVEELPAGLFAGLDKISHFSIDLRHNMLTYLSPDIFYANASTWKNVGTTLVSGGLLISENPWRCGCHLTWLGHWLRRWTRESLQTHALPIDTALKMHDIVKSATCTDPRTGQNAPIVQRAPEDISCLASALSTATEVSRTKWSILIFISVVTRLVI